jgi:hypothetical protein
VEGKLKAEPGIGRKVPARFFFLVRVTVTATRAAQRAVPSKASGEFLQQRSGILRVKTRTRKQSAFERTGISEFWE